MPNILTDLSARQAAKYGSRKAVSFKEPGSDRWTPITWSELDRNVSLLDSALETLGVMPQTMVGLFSANRP